MFDICYCRCYSAKRTELESGSLGKKPRRSSWSGRVFDRRSLGRYPSLPSLVTQWTCIRCLLDNSCTAASVCTACGASFSIAQTHARQVGARKCKRLNTHKSNGLKQAARVDLVTKVTTGLVTRVLDTSTNTLRISIGVDNIKIEGKDLREKFRAKVKLC